jgi:hypothetical protein
MADTIEGTAVVVRESSAPALWTPTFAVAIEEAVARKEAKHTFFKRVMVENVHYGVIPGTGTKPTLLKPGAEMLLSNMGLQPSFTDAEPPTLDITGAGHGGEAYIRYRKVCRIYRQLGMREDERMIVAQAEGSCSSWETKYRYRNDSLKCPICGKAAIIKGKQEFGGGYICFKKKGGCNAKFGDKDPAIVSQPVGKIPNPDLADVENTILKMADKRALVAATLLATGCSDIFTQDVEDFTGSAAGEAVSNEWNPKSTTDTSIGDDGGDSEFIEPKKFADLQAMYDALNQPATFIEWLKANVAPEIGNGIRKALTGHEKLLAEEKIKEIVPEAKIKSHDDAFDKASAELDAKIAARNGQNKAKLELNRLIPKKSAEPEDLRNMIESTAIECKIAPSEAAEIEARVLNGVPLTNALAQRVALAFREHYSVRASLEPSHAG